MTDLVRVADAAQALPALREFGCVIVEDVRSGREIDVQTAAVAEVEHGHPLGRNAFEGQRSHRLHGRPQVAASAEGLRRQEGAAALLVK